METHVYGIAGLTELINGDIFALLSCLDAIPHYILRALFVLFGALMCFAAFGTSRGFVEQGGVVLIAEPIRAIRNGIIVYFLVLALIVVFALTVILLPFSLLFFMTMLVMIVFGEASMSMLIGLTVARQFGKRFTPAISLWIGLLILAVISNIPILGAAVSYIFLPILSLGITLTCLINKLIKKKFYYTPFKPIKKAERKTSDCDHKAIRDVIKG